jgi:hypothetical protein
VISIFNSLPVKEGAADKIIGLELSDVAVDGCITKAACGREGIPPGAIAAPTNRHDSPLLDETLDALEVLGSLPEQMSLAPKLIREASTRYG